MYLKVCAEECEREVEALEGGEGDVSLVRARASEAAGRLFCVCVCVKSQEVNVYGRLRVKI